MLQTNTFLKTKIHIPFARKALLTRPDLLARLVEGFAGPFTLVTAPAGFGKTTLVVSGMSACGMPAAWLSLDKGDNQVDRFFGYLLLALQQVDAGIGQVALEILSSAPEARHELILTGLINDLVAYEKELTLVLDDFHSITNPVLHETVTFLLDHCPGNFHLVIATRSDPPVPLARLRSRGQVVELRAADLRFSVEEAAQFLNELIGLRLDPEAVKVLGERTEGWIAGLQMAALSMRDRKDVNSFITGFSGTNRYILDYLLEEVLANQPPEYQRFLLFTSILDRMCAPLCDALFEGDLEAASLSSAAILADLERSNLFLVSLDDERFWYRYHHLFADLLLARLNHVYPGKKPDLHRRAAAWLETQGMTVEAINHALAGGAHDQAARLVEENTSLLLARGELKALMGWIAVLPEELRQARPCLCVHQAYALAFAGRLPQVEPLLQQAEASASDTNQRLSGSISAVRAMIATMAGRDIEGLHHASRAREVLAEDQAWDRAAAAWAQGYSERSLGHLPEAKAAFEEMIRLARSMGNIWTLITGLVDLANVIRTQGQLSQARLLFEEALHEAAQQGARNLGYISRIESGLASVLYEQNKLEASQQVLSDAINHVHQWPNQNHLVHTNVIQTRLMLARNDLPEARASILEADRIRQNQALAGITRCMVDSGLVRTWLAFQQAGVALDPDDALARLSDEMINQWRGSLMVMEGSALDECGAMSRLMLARVQITTGQKQAALEQLAWVRDAAEQIGNIPVVLEALVLSAVAHQAEPSARAEISLEHLETALGLAQSGGFVRVFLDEDRLYANHPVQKLLAQWLARAGSHPARAYALYLAKFLDAGSEKVSPADAKPKTAQPLPEPLSQREIEVLSLIAEGLTNEAIARQLIISTGTVKAHTAAIYRKLDVINRTEAVARARQLKILP